MNPVWVIETSSVPRAIPKSMTLGPSSASNTFEGFRSRCTRFAAWIEINASASPAAKAVTLAAGNGPWLVTASCSDGPAM